MTDMEIDGRRVLLGRLLKAWPNANPADAEGTVDEYVTATRGVDLANLPRLVALVVDYGGEFAPPAGEILRRAARQYARASIDPDSYSSSMAYTDRVERLASEMVRRCQARARSVAPIGSGPLAEAARLSARPPVAVERQAARVARRLSGERPGERQ